MISISVIIPVFNGREYIKRCLDSLLAQDYNNFEIFIVDDSSTDGTLDIINKYAIKYKNINVKSLKENKGVSYARNCGINECNNDYILFCDSDDWYEPEALKILAESAEENDSDFVMSNHYISYNKNKIKINYKECFKDNHISKKECISYIPLSSCSKLIKKSLFIENNIFYPTNIIRCEELSVIPVLAFYALKPIFIENYLYNYYQRKDSASNNRNSDFSYFNESFKEFQKYIDLEKYNEEIEFRAIEHILYGKILTMLKSNINNKLINTELLEFKQKYPNYNKNKYLEKFSTVKKIFIKSLSIKCLLFAKIYAKLHSKLTG